MAVLNPVRFHMTALLCMLGGTLLIFLVLLMMNQFSDQPKKDKMVSTTEFKVKKPEPRPKKIEKKVKNRKKPSKPPPSPLPDLNADISGLDLGLPAFNLNNIGGVDESLLGDTSDLIMTSDMVDSVPQPRFRAEIQYPRRARAKEIEGYVVLSILISKDGHVEKVKVLEAEPVDVFEEKAVKNIKKWIFEPARYKGKTVRTWANQTIRFNLG